MDLEASTHRTLFRPTESDIVKEMQTADRTNSDMVENQPTKRGMGKSHIWFFTAMLKATERILKTKIEELSLLDQGNAEAVRMVTDEGVSSI